MCKRLQRSELYPATNTSRYGCGVLLANSFFGCLRLWLCSSLRWRSLLIRLCFRFTLEQNDQLGVHGVGKHVNGHSGLWVEWLPLVLLRLRSGQLDEIPLSTVRIAGDVDQTIDGIGWSNCGYRAVVWKKQIRHLERYSALNLKIIQQIYNI